MWHIYLCSFLSGMFLANGVPHFIKGGLGEKHQTPFGKRSSALINVLWGWLNLIVGVVILHFGHVWSHLYRAFALLAIGALLLTILNAVVWSSHAGHSK